MHTCSSLIVSCIDFRIQSFVEDWARKNLGEKNYDRVSWAGGVLKLDEIMGQVDISVRLHGIKKVILMNHEDCGAYGQAGTEDKHRHDLLSAADKIKNKYPDLSIETYFVRLDGQITSIS